MRALQPDAETIRTTFSQVDPDRLFDRALFDQTEISDLPGKSEHGRKSSTSR